MSISRSRVQPFTTIKFLAATTAMSTAILPVTLLGAGLVVCSTVDTLADDPAMIPLEYLKNNDGSTDRLGIWAAINDGKAQRYIFDTGSDQLTTQLGSEVTGVQPAPEATLAFAGGDAFAVRGTPIAKNAALLEAGLDAKVTRNASIGLAYQGQEHGFNAKLDGRF
ncbi:hypothetical protein ACWTU6_14060 [Mesorhizobium sp. BHbsci]